MRGKIYFTKYTLCIVKKEAKEKMKKRSWCGRDKEKEEKRKIAWSEIKN